jgi:hypothetical protein
LLVKRANDGGTFCLSNESVVIAPIFELDGSCADEFPALKNTDQKSWVDDWKVEGFEKTWKWDNFDSINDWSSLFFTQ